MDTDKRRPIAKLVAKCPVANGFSLRKNSIVKMTANANCSMALGLLIVASLASATTGQQASKQPASSSTSDLGVTQSYSEAIKWSFGGWEPLSQQQKALRNATAASGPHHPAQPIRMATNHHHLNITRPIQPPRQSRQGGPELLSESASSSQNNVHFATGQQQQKSLGAHGANQLEQATRQMQTGPAYAMQPTNKRPQEFSFPAPAPIVREQLLPATPDRRGGGGGGHQQRASEHRARPTGPHQQHFIYPIQQSAGPMHMQPSNNQHQHQAPYQRMPEHNNHYHHQSRRPQFPPHHHNNRHAQFMREMERRHKQHMMSHQRHQHHHMMMMRQQQQYRNHKMQQQHENRGHAPANPHLAVRNALMQAAHQETAPQNVATFKLIEGEQPVVFTAPQQLEAADHVGNRPNSSAVNHQTAPYSQMAPQTAMAAIEKDHLNYNQAMQQVSNSLEEHQRGQTSNNIQDVKQRQINNERRNNQQQQQQDPSKQRYLTIPVAVETAGDKVLTPDDINEIEKHVINVLPDLGTADKLVKLADSQLDLAHIKSSVEQVRKSSLEQQAQQQPQASPQQNHLQVSSIGPAELHQMNYEEHKSTMRQLENLARPTTPVAGGQYQQQSATSNSAAGTTRQQTRAHTATSQAASAPAAQHQSVEPQAGYQFVDESGELVEPQYYAPAGPAQEVEPVDPEQLGGDYNLIKNDLLQNVHYEPTRARPAHGGGSSSHSSPMQTASTPPMPNTATSHHQVNGHSSPVTSTTTTTIGIPTVTRYFHQGQAQATHQTNNNHNKPDRNNLFGRLRPNQQQGYQTSSTRTILGGRKVSEVMRPLVHTTPVPLTSPMHIPSVEPEKVDAIQFIAGNTASDKQPIVVEAHQLVTHTPDGGIDYSTGGMQQPGQPQQQQPSGNQTHQLLEQQQQQAQQQQQQQFYPQANPNEESQGAIIEYVSISDQALNNALANQHQQPSSNVPADSHNQQQQSYEMSSTPEGNQQIYSNSPQPPLLYAYSTQQQHEAQNQASTPTYNGPTESPQAMLAAHNNNHQQQQQQQQQQEPSLAAWSPSIASEHQQQQQQLELSGQSGPMQQLEFPATAGYNLFGQQQDDQQSMSMVPNYSNEQQDQQQQQESEQDHHSRWRTKAGGRQPNPDAQYDGQMVKATQADGDDGDDEQQQQQEKKGEHQIQQVMMIDGGQQPQQHYQTTVGFANQQQQPTPNQAAGAGQQADQTSEAIELQQQHDRVNHYEQQPEATGASQAPYQAQGSTMNNDGFDSTSAYVGGAQMNHQTPSGGMRYSRPPQSFGQTSSASSSDQATSPFGYAKLDRDHQQQHLEQQRVEHQSQLAELMDQQQQRQQQYQTTTPISVTTVSEQQQQPSRNEQEVRQDQEQPNQQVVGDSQTALLISPDGGHQTLHMPAILDQQSLIHDQDQNGGGPLASSDDAGSKQRHHRGHQQPVFQVYQAYYAPKDHKPLPGYVRLSLDEFNHLFKDAEIQFVDKNTRSLTANLMAGSSQDGQMQSQMPMGGNEQQVDSNYDARSQQDHMRASGSELQSIVVDRRSIADRRSSSASLINSTISMGQEKLLDSDKKLRQLGQAAVKKIISIANSRQAAVKQQSANKLVMKRAQAPILTTPPTITTTATGKLNVAATSTTTTTSSPISSTDSKSAAKSSAVKTSQNMPKKKNQLTSSGRNHSDGAQRDKTAASKKTKSDEHKKQVAKV